MGANRAQPNVRISALLALFYVLDRAHAHRQAAGEREELSVRVARMIEQRRQRKEAACVALERARIDELEEAVGLCTEGTAPHRTASLQLGRTLFSSGQRQRGGDLLTKILPTATFIRLRDLILVFPKVVSTRGEC